MRQIHLTEAEIQNYAFDKSASNPEVTRHVSTCEACSKKVETYQLLFQEMGKEPGPAFDFNVTDLILPQLKSPESRFSWSGFVVYFLMFIGVLSIGITVYKMIDLFSGLDATTFYLITMIGLSILIFQTVGFYKRYREQIKILDT